ncbi:hypothetical protein L2E82_11672 [Cichorium intybus]|uniref:Uncharacterized protein n=1 Tax=Cichorium intybus TaxID=13427 RepID=A0ACB9GE47_CICIN|nr:hypothetical protein L2E82_11672 [Cichorium intybus]
MAAMKEMINQRERENELLELHFNGQQWRLLLLPTLLLRIGSKSLPQVDIHPVPVDSLLMVSILLENGLKGTLQNNTSYRLLNLWIERSLKVINTICDLSGRFYGGGDNNLVCFIVRHYGVKPILIFHGGHLPMKNEQEIERARSRKENPTRAIEHESCGDTSAAYEYYQKAVDIPPTIAYELIPVIECISKVFN